MLEIVFTEADQIHQRGLNASTFVSQPFWQEMQKYLYDQVAEAQRKMEECKEADERIQLHLLRVWRTTKELAARIERFPQLAIEAARELGE